MTEAVEAAGLLRMATSRSLVLMDELGRGTSTHDGYAIALAVTSELVRRKCLCAFATHFHSLSEEPELQGFIQPLHMRTLVQGDYVTHLYQVTRGAADKSHALAAARVAGLSQPLLLRAAAMSEAVFANKGKIYGGGSEASTAAPIPCSDAQVATVSEIVSAINRLSDGQNSTPWMLRYAQIISMQQGL